MKRLLLLPLIFHFQFSILHSQSWSQLGAGLNGVGKAACISNSYLYVGGTFTLADGNSASNIAKWDGAQWTALGTGVNNSIYCMCEYHGQLIAAGAFTNAGGLNARKIARWNGVSWDTLGRGINGLAIYDMKVYHDKLYVTGKFGQAGTTIVKNIAVWNDTDWADVGGGLASVWTSVEGNALEVYNDELYVGGKFDIAGTDSMVMHLARWNGNTWNGCADGLYYTDHVYALAVFNGKLIAGGDITSNGSSTVFVNNLIAWNGTGFSGTGPGVNTQVEALYHYGNFLYIGGQFNLSSTTIMNKITMWNGSMYAPMSNGCNSTVYAIVADEAIIYAIGNFTSAGSAACSHVAKWSMTGVGIDEQNSSGEVSMFPNPSNGIFAVHSDIRSTNEVLYIYNSLGEKIFEERIENNDALIDLTSEPPGVYFYSLRSDDKQVMTGKIVVSQH